MAQDSAPWPWQRGWSDLPCDLRQTRMFLQATFRPDDVVRVMLVRRAEPAGLGRVSGVPRAVGEVEAVFDRADRLWGRRALHQLRSANLNGCDVFFNVNPVDGLGGDRGHLAGAARVHLDVDREAYWSSTRLNEDRLGVAGAGSVGGQARPRPVPGAVGEGRHVAREVPRVLEPRS